MVWVRVALEVAAGVVLGWRCLRVAQREHYVPGSVFVTLGRWNRVAGVNLVPPLVAVVAIGWAVVIGCHLGGLVAEPGWLAVAGCLVLVPWPFGLRGITGRPPLATTGRALRLGALTVAVTVAAGFASWGLLSHVGRGPARGEVCAGLAIALIPVWVEVGLAAARPIEAALLGAFVRTAEKKLRRLGPEVVAVTGSYGKTSVKEHVRDLVGRQRQLTASPASFNNQAGLARTVNEHLTPGTEVLVCEMGTYGPGEIAAMCRWVRPRVAAITRIGPVHLERMKTLEGIRDAKAEILRGAEVAVLNVDDPLLAELADRVADTQRVIRCSTDAASGADVVVAPAADGGHTVVVQGEEVAKVAPLPTGVHPSNVAIALGCGIAIGVDPTQLTAGIGALLPPSHRLDPATSDAGVVVLDDTFNSNPEGARAALAALVAVAGPGRRVVVTPGMVELGSIQRVENERLAGEVARAGAELVIVGRVNRRALVAGYDAGRPPVVVPHRADAVAWVRSELGPGDAVLYENDLPDHYP